MLNANDILLPPTPEEIKERIKKRIEKFEHEFPGVVQAIEEWMLGDEFKELCSNENFLAPLIKMGWAPIFMRVKINILAGLDPLYNNWTNGIPDLLWRKYNMKYNREYCHA